MATEEDLYIEVDGKRVVFTTKTVTDEIVKIPELSVVHRAVVNLRDNRYVASLVSGGISGNAIEIQIIDTTSGAAVSGLTVSGKLLDIVAAGA